MRWKNYLMSNEIFKNIISKLIGVINLGKEGMQPILKLARYVTLSSFWLKHY